MESSDLLIRGGIVIDGTGRPGFQADIRIRQGIIAEISPGLLQSENEQAVSAEGMIVAPGFIDAHCHTDMYAAEVPDACGKILQGVTTDVCGLCGDSPAPIGKDHLGEYRKRREYQLPGGRPYRACTFQDYCCEMNRSGNATNMALFVGNTNLRVAAAGYRSGPADAAELEMMKSMLLESLEAGAFGLSTGLTYYPSGCSSEEELTALCRAAAPYGAIYNSHMRNESDRVEEAIGEVIRIAEKSGCRGHISHLKMTGKRNHGKAEHCLELIHEAAGKGIDISFDVYPYTAGSCGLATLLPPEVREKGSAKETLLSADTIRRCEARIRETDWDNLVLTCGEENILLSAGPEELVGKTLKEISASLGISAPEAVLRVLAETSGQGSVIYHALSEKNLLLFMKDPLCSIGSDAFARNYTGPTAAGTPHPRNYGNFPRFLRKYVLEQKVFSMEEAVRKITGLPAAQFGLRGKGIIQTGIRADLTVFDPETIRETGNFLKPASPPEGIAFVIQNGRIAAESGRYTGIREGKILRPGRG